ncbi:hypothetical protein BGZ54_005254 [Gamsiella multidivaricata]|nr:hypothetical protein BGZ54_005254 [Gamsiella multidivaricata]
MGALMGLCILAAVWQGYKIRNSDSCTTVPEEYRQFCSTTKAAVVTMYLAALNWVVWLGWWSYKCIYKVRQDERVEAQTTEEGQRSEIMISMPDESRSDGDMKEAYIGVGTGIAEVSVAMTPSQRQHPTEQNRHCQHQIQEHLPPQQVQQGAPSQAQLQSSQDSQRRPVTEAANDPVDSASINSLGLGIDICTKSFMEGFDKLLPTTEDTENGTSDNRSFNPSNTSLDQPTASSSTSNLPSKYVNSGHGSLNRLHPKSASIHDIHDLNYDRDIGTAPNSAQQRGRSNSVSSSCNQSISGHSTRTLSSHDRLRDHAKIFRMPRSRSGSINDIHSCRGTPMIPSTSAASLSRLNGNRLFSPNVSTPTTPLSRREMGYMGAHTIKALNSGGGTRTVSMGHIAAFNSLSCGTSTMPSSVAGSAAPSVHGSPLLGSMDASETPRSYRSMSSFFGPGPLGNLYPQTPAEAEAAEQSMDEHLKSVRRRSFAAKTRNRSPDHALRARIRVRTAPLIFCVICFVDKDEFKRLDYIFKYIGQLKSNEIFLD